MTTREQSRIAVLNGVMEGKVLVAEAARLMDVSERHVPPTHSLSPPSSAGVMTAVKNGAISLLRL